MPEAPMPRARSSLIASMDGFRPRYTPRALASAIPSPLPAQMGLELRKHTQHVQEALPGCGASIDGLLRGPQGRAARLHRTNDVLKVSNAMREAVNTRDHQHVTGSQEVEQSAQLSAPCGGCGFSERIKSQRVSILRDWTAPALLEPPTKGSGRISHDVTAWLGLMLRRLFNL